MKNENALLYLLTGCFVILLILPTTNTIFNFFEPEELNGEFTLKEEPTISFDSWMDYKFQPEYEAWLEENIGFRHTFIRIYNQMLFSVFNESTANGIFIGKDNVLYQNGYFNAYVGNDYVGLDKIIDGSKKTQFIQNKLIEKNIPFLFVMAPGKVSVYPEFLPSDKQKVIPDTTNNGMYTEYFKKNEINFINFNELFKQIKGTSHYPLFPKGGIHWSGYSVAYAADTILNRLDQLSEFTLPEIEISKGKTTSNDFVFTDNDLEKLMNLALPLRTWELNYPTVNFKAKSKDKPKILIIGDSFVQSFFEFDSYNSSVFSNESRYWQGYNFGYWAPDTSEYFYKIDKLNLVDIVESFDMVMVLTTEINMNNLGLGFIDDLYKSYLKPINNEFSNAKTVGYFDFENSTSDKVVELLPEQQDTTSGKYANKVSSEKQFSRTFRIDQSDLTLANDRINLAVTVNYLIDSISNNFERDISIVFEINSGEPSKNLTYKTWDLRAAKTLPNQWNEKTIYFNAPVPMKEFRISVYVYNTGQIPILIDNFEIKESVKL